MTKNVQREEIGREITEEGPIDEEIESAAVIIEPENEKSRVDSALGLNRRTLKARRTEGFNPKLNQHQRYRASYVDIRMQERELT